MELKVIELISEKLNFYSVTSQEEICYLTGFGMHPISNAALLANFSIFIVLVWGK